MMMVSLFLALVSASDAHSRADDASDVERYQSHKMSVCRIVALHPAMNPLFMGNQQGAESMGTQPGFGGGMSQSVGSGFVIQNDDQGPLMVTNAHVVADAPNVFIQYPALGPYTFEARVVLVNHDMDLAFVKVATAMLEKLDNVTTTKGMPVTPVQLFKGKVTFGMKALAMGFPLGSKTIKLSTGILSGHEDVNSIVYQHTAPISPGSSGGPLFLKGTSKVIAVNFATANQDSSQQNNYAIPAYRVEQMITQYRSQQSNHMDVEIVPVNGDDDVIAEEGEGEDDVVGMFPGFGGFGGMFPGLGKKYKGYDLSKCEADRNDPACEYRLPKLSSVVTVGGPPLYTKYGCSAGVLLSSIAPESYLKFADPPIGDYAFLTKVNDVEIDQYGMGRMDDLFDDPIRFEDILFSNSDVSQDGVVEVCSCGQTTTHKVPLKWNSKMEKQVPFFAEPAFASLDYESFAGVTVSPLTMNIAAASSS
jgi:S1-C subfamily serine protease